MTIKRNALIDFFWWVHPKVYLWSSGFIGGSIGGLPVLLLTTRGRKSGLLRTKALTYLSRGTDFIVIASNLGQKNHPAWWLNLKDQPIAIVQIGGNQFAVRAREAEEKEREALWMDVIEMEPAYDDYQAQTSRRIPVVVLERQ